MSRFRLDGATLWLLRGCGVLTGALVLLVVAHLVVESLPALRSIGPARFVTDSGWSPTSRGEADAARFDLSPMLIGSLAATSGAILLAAPLGLISAIFCRFYAPRALARSYRRWLELLAGIPSVVYGLWGLVVLAPLIRRIAPPGTSLLAGILILALMCLPTIALLSEAALRNVPRAYLDGAAALGLSRWGTVRRVALPAARDGVGIAIALGTARAIGETMAVLMVCGNVVRVPDSVFDPVRTLTANIALELGYAAGDHRSALFVSGLVLMASVVALVGVSDRLRRKATP